MKKFQIESEAAQILGIFEADDEAGALDAMMRDAGYESYADYKARCDRDEEFSGKIIEVAPRIVAEEDLIRPYFDGEGDFLVSSIPGPYPSRIMVVFEDFEGAGEYACSPDECGRRGSKSARFDPLVRIEIE